MKLILLSLALSWSLTTQAAMPAINNPAQVPTNYDGRELSQAELETEALRQQEEEAARLADAGQSEESDQVRATNVCWGPCPGFVPYVGPRPYFRAPIPGYAPGYLPPPPAYWGPGYVPPVVPYYAPPVVVAPPVVPYYAPPVVIAPPPPVVIVPIY